MIVLVVGFGCFIRAQDQPQTTQYCFIGPKDLGDASAPRFEQYPVKPSPPTSPANLDLRSNPVARRYRTVIRQQMKEGPNLAGHYRVAIWGCGTSCAQFAVVNLKSGRVITANDVESVSGVGLYADDFLPSTDSEGWGFRHRKDSRLLVLVGTINEDEAREGAFYYVLTHDRLVMLHETIAARNTCEQYPD